MFKTSICTKNICVSNMNILGLIYSVILWEGLKVGEGKQVSPEPKTILAGNALSKRKITGIVNCLRQTLDKIRSCHRYCLSYLFVWMLFLSLPFWTTF